MGHEDFSEIIEVLLVVFAIGVQLVDDPVDKFRVDGFPDHAVGETIVHQGKKNGTVKALHSTN
jgi:hypothetical protein